MTGRNFVAAENRASRFSRKITNRSSEDSGDESSFSLAEFLLGITTRRLPGMAPFAC